MGSTEDPRAALLSLLASWDARVKGYAKSDRTDLWDVAHGFMSAANDLRNLVDRVFPSAVTTNPDHGADVRGGRDERKSA